MTPEVHYLDEEQIFVSQGPLLMRIVGSMQSSREDADRLFATAEKVLAKQGRIGTVVVFCHGAIAPHPVDIPHIVATTRKLEALGPGVGVFHGLRPLAYLLFQAAISVGRLAGMRVPMETQLEAAARRIAAELEEVTIEDVLSLYAEGAKRILVRPRQRR